MELSVPHRRADLHRAPPALGVKPSPHSWGRTDGPEVGPIPHTSRAAPVFQNCPSDTGGARALCSHRRAARWPSPAELTAAEREGGQELPALGPLTPPVGAAAGCAQLRLPAEAWGIADLDLMWGPPAHEGCRAVREGLGEGHEDAQRARAAPLWRLTGEPGLFRLEKRML